MLDRYASERHGPCRVWYASGQLQLEGQYADDRRDGVWTFYDEQGGVTEEGAYKQGLRDGEWLVAGTKPGPGVLEAASTGNAPGAGLLPAKVTFVAGRTREEHEALLARLAADLAGGSIRQQVAAATRLVELGPAAVPVLTAAFDGNSPETKILALRSLMRLDALSPQLLPKIEPLVDHSDSRLALRAMLAVYELAPQRRSKLYPRIMALLDQSPRRELAVEALVQICNLDADRRMLAFMSLMELLAKDSPPLGSGDPFAPFLWIDEQPLQRLTTDPVPLLAAAFGHSDPGVRIYVLVVLEQIVESGETERPFVTGVSAQWTWPVPPAVQAVLDKAKTDPDPEVRLQAEQVGRGPPGGGGVF